jgi:hypothetical protein
MIETCRDKSIQQKKGAPMHRLLAMKATDLAELYWLLSMYQSTYELPVGRDMNDLLKDIQKVYEEQAVSCGRSTALPPKLSNPRGAGRKKVYTDTMKNEILQLHISGSTIRGIASQLKCSSGYVHEIISEQASTDAHKSK